MGISSSGFIERFRPKKIAGGGRGIFMIMEILGEIRGLEKWLLVLRLNINILHSLMEKLRLKS